MAHGEVEREFEKKIYLYYHITKLIRNKETKTRKIGRFRFCAAVLQFNTWNVINGRTVHLVIRYFCVCQSFPPNVIILAGHVTAFLGRTMLRFAPLGVAAVVYAALYQQTFLYPYLLAAVLLYLACKRIKFFPVHPDHPVRRASVP